MWHELPQHGVVEVIYRSDITRLIPCLPNK
jgi:hypothetical protein